MTNLTTKKTAADCVSTVVWITGLPQSGKSTLAARLAGSLTRPACVLDSDAVRAALVPTRGYSDGERDDFYESLGNLAALLASQGLLVIVAATANRRVYRDRVAERHGIELIEVHVTADLDTCRDRDTKELYAKNAEALPGVGRNYEPPRAPAVRATGGHDDEALAALLALVESDS